MKKMKELVRELEVTLGPDTADLAMRVGLHSGPVTAGVLRGDRARFQLFGDTVNTAARMESTGVKKKIQISQETAELIISAGKANWLKRREDIVHAKGKGELQTFWLLPKAHHSSGTTYTPSEGTSTGEDLQDALAILESEPGNSEVEETEFSEGSGPESLAVHNERIQRLVDYTSDILLSVLKKIVRKLFGISKPKQKTE